MSILLSIVIPTYNGENTIQKTIQNIVLQIQKDELEKFIEIVVTDDFSSDKTTSIVTDLDKEYHFLHLFRNSENLGMDKNFVQCMHNAKGKYVWFCGQDDELKEGLVRLVVSLLTESSDIQNVYLDFSQCDESKQIIYCQSMISKQLLKPSRKNVFAAHNSSEYFALMSDSPSFLPATIVRKDDKLLKKLELLIDTHYVQYAYFTLGLNSGKTVLLKKQLILGPIPSNGWQKNGNKLYEIAVGKLYAQHVLNNKHENVFPSFLLEKKKREFIANYVKLLILSFYYGLNSLEKPKIQLNTIFTFGYQRYYVFALTSIFEILITLKNKLSF